jgi:IMP dehydrogenase
MVLTAEDIMSSLPQVLPSDLTVEAATKIMVSEKRGFVLIGNGGNISGIATEWDFVSKVLSNGKDPRNITLGEIMSTEIKSVEPETPTRKVTVIMSKNGIRRILVGKDGKYSGIITSRDILRIFEDYVENVENIAGKYGLL